MNPVKLLTKTLKAQADLRARLELIITGIVLVVVGFVAVNIAYGFGEYILETLNKSLGGTLRMLVQPNSMSIVGTAFVVAGVLLVIIAVAEMIRELRKTTEVVGAPAT